MTLAAGSTLGSYEIRSLLGVGGMGEVYCALDKKLGREVAIKVLPEAFARDPNRLARFEREARVLASLNHPNIAAIYGLEHSGDDRFLVLELAPGVTLAERLRMGPLSIPGALAIFIQVAAGVEAAHESGVVHRDLKPANIKISENGRVKILDFGLAKAFDAGSSQSDILGTLDLGVAGAGPISREGVILGTPPYMSPEQARGLPVDRRADVWSFGCCLFEALAGQRPFYGSTASDTIASILNDLPPWDELPRETPDEVLALLRRCLHKQPQRRLQSVGDARVELEEALEAGREGAPAGAARRNAARRPSPFALAAGAFAILLLGAAAGLYLNRPAAPLAESKPAAPVRLAIGLPEASHLSMNFGSPLAISRDGRRIVYSVVKEGVALLHSRFIDRYEVSPLAGTEGAQTPFFSPDDRSVGFYAEGRLKRVNLENGAVETLCDASDALGADWLPNGDIIYVPSFLYGLWRLPAGGGPAQALTKLDEARGEIGHLWPRALPGGEDILYTAWTGGSYNNARVILESLRTGERRVLIEHGSTPRYASSGHLLYMHDHTIHATRFDLAAVKSMPPGVPLPRGAKVLIGSSFNDATGAAYYDLAENGTLVYVEEGSWRQAGDLVWANRKGEAEKITPGLSAYWAPALSPDGSKIAFTSPGGAGVVIQIYDLARATLWPLSREGVSIASVWHPDGKRVVYSSDRDGGAYNLYLEPIDGSAPPLRLLSSAHIQFPTSWTPDGKTLLYTEFAPKTRFDVWRVDLEGLEAPMPLLDTPADEFQAVLSPDGKWMAYASNESGNGYEVWARPFPAMDRKWQISNAGGIDPVWTADGKDLQIVYQRESAFYSVKIETAPEFRAGKPELLFDKEFSSFSIPAISGYDATADGEKLLLVRSTGGALAGQINVVLDWTSEVREKAPAGL